MYKLPKVNLWVEVKRGYSVFKKGKTNPKTGDPTWKFCGYVDSIDGLFWLLEKRLVEMFDAASEHPRKFKDLIDDNIKVRKYLKKLSKELKEFCNGS